MKLGILHLSDCHIQTGTEPFLRRVNEVIAATRNFESAPDSWLVIFSGDLSNAGQQQELSYGVAFINEVCSKLHAQSGHPSVVVTVPGNHDCFIPDEKERQILTKAVRSGDSTARERILEAQKCFWQVCPHCKTYDFNNRLAFLETIVCNGRKVAILGLNSSWMSDKHESQGQIEFDPAWLKTFETWVYQNNPDLVITVTHHPLYWQGERVHQQLWDGLERMTDLLFTGHEHTSGSFVRTTQDASVTVIEGGLLHSKGRERSSFNVVHVDLKSNRISRYLSNWDTQSESYCNQLQFNKELTLNANRARFSLHQSWLEELEASTLKFCHPRKNPLDLSSFYTWPSLKMVSHKSNNNMHCNGRESLLRFLGEHKRLRIVGNIKSGKTVMLKMLYKELVREGYVPVMVDLELLQRNVEVSIARAVESQYRSLKASDITSVPKLVILIDNFDRLRVKLSKKLEIVEQIANGANYCVLVTNNRNDLEYMAGKYVSVVWDSFRILEIEDLTRTQRSDLLFALAKINAPLELEDHQIEREVEQCNDHISTILGHNLVPATPLIVVTLWREIQAGNTPSNVGSQGHLYDYLIKYMFEKTEIKPGDIGFDVRYNYLSYLAYALYNQREVLTSEEMATIDTKFTRETSLKPDMPRIISDCIHLGILKEKDDGLCFGQEYISYYFAAYYIWQHKSQSQEVSIMLERITNNIYELANAQITIFYTYLSSDEVIMLKVLRLAENCLIDADEFNYVILKPSQLAMAQAIRCVVSDPEVRSAYLDNRNELEQNMVPENMRSDTALQNITLARRLSMVLGQIVRNFPVTLANKLGADNRDAYVRQGYRLHLITLKLAVRYLEVHAADLVQHMESILKQEGIKVPEIASKRYEILQLTMNIFINTIISQTVIEIPHLLCSKDIMSVHTNIINKERISNPIYDVIDAAMQIDYRTTYPLAFIQKLAKELWQRDENAWETLKHVVYLSLLKYSRNSAVIQALCTTFELTYQTSYLLKDKKV